MNPFPMVAAGLRRNPFTSVLFVAVIAVAVALGIAISAQERALRQGSARAADKFDLVVAAPGSQTDILFAAVYLDPRSAELLSPEMTAQVLNDPDVAFAAPIGFGDNVQGMQVVGSTAAFVTHLSGGLAEGRTFAAMEEAVVGALVPIDIGTEAGVGHGDADEIDADHAHDHGHDHSHDHGTVKIVGRMQPTGTPWDRAVIVPIEFTWAAHGMPTGHAEGDTHLGAPFDPANLAGIPAAIVKPKSLADAYGLRSRYRTAESTAFFPAEVLVDLYAVMGDIARVMGALTLAAQALVVAAILAGLLALLDLQRRRFAVLRALGAPSIYVFAVVWCQTAALIVAGAAVGVPLGWLAAQGVSGLVADATGVAMTARIGLRELGLAGALLALGLLLATVPAALTWRRPIVEGLR